MIQRWRRLFLSCSVMVIASCYAYMGRYVGPGLVEIAAMREGVERYLSELNRGVITPADVQLTRDSELEVRHRPGDRLGPTDASAGESILRFGLLSDVHIRDPAVKLFADRVSRDLRTIVESFESNPVQEAFQPAVYLATLKAFAALQGDQRPRFLIHTGDAIDAGTIEEIFQFIYITRQSPYPFLNVVGNHDDSMFGNYKKRLSRRAEGIHLVGKSLGAFLARHNPGSANEDTLPDLETLSCSGAPAERAGSTRGRSRCLGFDLRPQPDARSCQLFPGFYAYTLKTCTPDTVQVIVLDSTRKFRWGADSWGTDEMETRAAAPQLAWLDQQLKMPASIRLVFIHHGPTSMPPLLKRLQEAGRRGPVVAFSGDSHAFNTEWRDGFWELNSGALAVWPQWARLIELRRHPSGRLMLVARALRLEAASPGIMQWTRDQLDQALLECKALARLPLAAVSDPHHLLRSALCGYYGAEQDRRLIRARVPFAPVPAFDESWRQANVLLDITQP